MIDLEGRLEELLERQEDMLGDATSLGAITATLRVSPDGTGVDGLSWRTAYQTLQDALDAASTDANDCTLILLAPTATFYDINTTDDPTWTGNYEIRATHRAWAFIRNNHVGATSVMNFSGKVSLRDLAIVTTGSVNGVCFTSNGWRVCQCGFNSSGTSGANTSLHADGSGALTRGGRIEDTVFVGNVTHTTAYQIEQSAVNIAREVTIHSCLVGIHIIDSDSDYNEFHDCDIGDCALGIDIDAGNEQHFANINFHHNTRDVDDEVGDHTWIKPSGAFAITTAPDDLAGVTITAGVGANAWSAADTQVRGATDNPFRVVGVVLDPDANEKYRVRLYDGTTYFTDVWAEGGVGVAAKGTQAPSGTEFIFNRGIVISASAKSESGGNDIDVSVQVQEI